MDKGYRRRRIRGRKFRKGKGKGKGRKRPGFRPRGRGKGYSANLTEDPSATSTAHNTSWQGDDASGVGIYRGMGLLWRRLVSVRLDDISHAHENTTTELTVHAFGTDTEGTHKETKSEQTSLVSFCAQHSEQSFFSSVTDLSREPTFVILDTGCTRSMGSRHAVNRLMQACSKQEPNFKPHLVQDGTMSEYVYVRKRGNVRDHSEIGHVLCPF